MSYPVSFTFHSGLGHASPPCPPPPGAATACSPYFSEWWSILPTQATPPAIPAGSAVPTHGDGQRWLSSATVPWQRGTIHAVSPL